MLGINGSRLRNNHSILSLCLSPFYGHFPGGPGLTNTRMSPFWILLELRMMEVVVTTGAIRRAKLQSNHHHQQTNIQLLTGRMPTPNVLPFLSPNQWCQSTEGKISYSMDLLTPSSPGGLPTLSLTTNSSWLPWRRVAMPLISPLMPVPQSPVISTE